VKEYFCNVLGGAVGYLYPTHRAMIRSGKHCSSTAMNHSLDFHISGFEFKIGQHSSQLSWDIWFCLVWPLLSLCPERFVW